MGKLIGSSIKRVEDSKYITGKGLYVDDIQIPGMLHAAVLRSHYAHARILSINVSRALKLPKVRAVYVAEDLGKLNGPLPPSVSPLPQYPVDYKTHYALAKDKVRYVGEPVAFVVAEDKYHAKDALEYIDVEYEPLKPVVDIEEAIRPSSPLVHEDIGSNIAAHNVVKVGDYSKAAKEAYLIIRERFVFNRGAGHSIETRGVVADYDPRTGYLTVWDSTQAPVPIRNGLAKLLGLPEHRVRVIAPDVGGGFGPKIMLFYPEEVLVPFASINLGKPVKWVEERQEYSVAANQERIQIHNVEAAFSKEGKIIGLKDEFLVDTGAYTPYGVMVPIITLATLPGPYRIPNYHVEFKSVYTNKTIVSPVRGAGRPTAVFVMERIMDIAARKLGIDRAKIREVNLLQPEDFPYDVGVTYQDAAPTRYDSGNYKELLRKLLESIGYGAWSDEKENYRKEGRRVGLGIALYVEGAGVGPYESVKVTVQPSGKVTVSTAVGTQGQGHFTSLAQVVADVIGVGVEDVEVITGDTEKMQWGIGTFASRAATIAGNAAYLAAQEVKKKAVQLAAEALGASPEDIVLEEGKAYVRGLREKYLTLGEIATRANPLRGLVKTEPGLEATKFFSPTQSVFSSGGHAAKVEVDAETGEIRILEYVIVHDCGKVINPMIVEGQLIGGFVMGLGSAWYEEIVHDEEGQPLTVTFMDYLIPSAVEVNFRVCIHHLETPSPLNPLGVKGVGEAGVIPVAATLASAIEDALSDLNVNITKSPLSQHKLWELLSKAKKATN